MSASLSIHPLENFPLVEPGDNLNQLIAQSLGDNNLSLQQGDVLVIAQKIISKAEGRYAYLNHIIASDEAIILAAETDKDPRQVELILRESEEIIRARPGVIIVEHKLGYVHANAGIDKSNIESDDDNPRVLLLPEDSDRSAEQIRDYLNSKFETKISVIINDSAGRAWRNGTVGMAIGTAGFEVLDNKIGDLDLFDRKMEVTEVAVADELAAAASFVMGQAREGLPITLIRGATLKPSDKGSSALIRDKSLDMFR